MTKPLSDQQKIEVLRIALAHLEKLTLPSMSRDLSDATLAGKPEGSFWVLNSYCFSVLLHLRYMLAGIVQQHDMGNWPMVWVLARHLFEWAAHASHIHQTTSRMINDKKWRECWQFLTDVMVANLWMQKYGKNIAKQIGQPFPNLPKSIRIMELVEAYEKLQDAQYGEAVSEGNYGLLSEYSHANAAALSHYHRWTVNGSDAVLTFEEPETKEVVNVMVPSCIDLLMTLNELLGISGEVIVRPQLVRLLHDVAQSRSDKHMP